MINPDNSAYPEYFTDGYGSRFQGIDGNTEKMWCSNPGGFTKREIVLKDFMCAITTGIYSNLEINSNFIGEKSDNKYFLKHLIAKYASELTEEYFNQLNKQP